MTKKIRQNTPVHQWELNPHSLTKSGLHYIIELSLCRQLMKYAITHIVLSLLLMIFFGVVTQLCPCMSVKQNKTKTWHIAMFSFKYSLCVPVSLCVGGGGNSCVEQRHSSYLKLYKYD